MSFNFRSPAHGHASTTGKFGSQAPGLPPFGQVLKSREVEDPVNLWVHRPLAYAFCRLVYRTSITPNQVTLIAIVLGLTAAACWVDGSPWAMVWGGALLWTSAIMDGADGILARAKNMQSAFGRALDGTADMVVGLATVAACIYHLAVNGASTAVLLASMVALFTTVLQLNLYDFYKELHMRLTRLELGGESEDASGAVRLVQSEAVRESAWYTKLSMGFYADYLRSQERLIRLTNPEALRLTHGVVRGPATAESYRRHNRRPMQLWMAVSLAPHSYLFAIFGMFDQLDIYLLVRLVIMNALMGVGLVSQRRATLRTVTEYQARGWLGG
jgi:phosphatidylglycerophosphate synthase